MIGKWIDLAILVLLALGLLKGFRKGLVRELFSLLGAVLAVVIAYRGYLNVSLILLEKYPVLDAWQAQAISFAILIVAISLLGALIGYFGSKALKMTPFAILDQVGGAAFGLVKVGVAVLLLLIVLNSIHIGFVDALLDESVVIQQISVFVPFVYDYLEDHWPEKWYRPLWLFPDKNPTLSAGFSWEA